MAVFKVPKLPAQPEVRMIFRLVRGVPPIGRDFMRRVWPQVAMTPMKRAGLLIRKIAVRSIRHTQSMRPSRPGTPPRSRAAGRPMRRIMSVTEGMNREIVGSVHLGSRPPVPGLHEHGLSAVRTVITTGQNQARNMLGQFGKKINRRQRRMIHYPQREFMGRALLKALPRLPALWKNSLRFTP